MLLLSLGLLTRYDADSFLANDELKNYGAVKSNVPPPNLAPLSHRWEVVLVAHFPTLAVFVVLFVAVPLCF